MKTYQLDVTATLTTKADSPEQARTRLVRVLKDKGFDEHNFEIHATRLTARKKPGEAEPPAELNPEERALLGFETKPVKKQAQKPVTKKRRKTKHDLGKATKRSKGNKRKVLPKTRGKTRTTTHSAQKP